MKNKKSKDFKVIKAVVDDCSELYDDSVNIVSSMADLFVFDGDDTYIAESLEDATELDRRLKAKRNGWKGLGDAKFNKENFGNCDN